MTPGDAVPPIPEPGSQESRRMPAVWLILALGKGRKATELWTKDFI